MWGVYPVDNCLFMKNDISYDYKFIIGHLFGVIIKKELCSHTLISEQEMIMKEVLNII